MAKITRATALANNEVAYLAWAIDPERIPGCLGFHIVREYLDPSDHVTAERPLASYVAFEGQRNPDWQAQNTTVWPVQKFTWRDLTLRKRRDRAERRPDNERVRYRIRAVGRMQPPRPSGDRAGEPPRQEDGRGRAPHLHRRPNSAWLPHRARLHQHPRRDDPASALNLDLHERHSLDPVSRPRAGRRRRHQTREGHLRKPQDWLRDYLAGDVLSVKRDFFSQPGGRLHAALYELEDEELVGLLKENAERLDLILSDAGSGTDKNAEENENGKKPTIYDTRNRAARKRPAGPRQETRHHLPHAGSDVHLRHDAFAVFHLALDVRRAIGRA